MATLFPGQLSALSDAYLDIDQCMQLEGYKFCTPFSDKSLDLGSEGVGHCCPALGFNLSPICLSRSQCTLVSDGSLSIQEKIAYKSFYPGIAQDHINKCASELILNPELSVKKQKNIVLTSNDFSCEYRVQTPQLTYRSTGKIWIWFE